MFRFDEAAPGRGPVHWADGSGVLIRGEEGWILRLNADFKAGPGPNFWIYLSTSSIGEESDFNADAGRVSIARACSALFTQPFSQTTLRWPSPHAGPRKPSFGSECNPYGRNDLRVVEVGVVQPAAAGEPAAPRCERSCASLRNSASV